LDDILAWNVVFLPVPVSVTTPVVLSKPVPGVMDHAGTVGMGLPLLDDGLEIVTFPAPSTTAVYRYHPGLAPVRITCTFQVPVRSPWEKVGFGGFGVAVTSLDSALSPSALAAVTTK
jgi:hypothetical protein